MGYPPRPGSGSATCPPPHLRRPPSHHPALSSHSPFLKAHAPQSSPLFPAVSPGLAHSSQEWRPEFTDFSLPTKCYTKPNSQQAAKFSRCECTLHAWAGNQDPGHAPNRHSGRSGPSGQKLAGRAPASAFPPTKPGQSHCPQPVQSAVRKPEPGTWAGSTLLPALPPK